MKRVAAFLLVVGVITAFFLNCDDTKSLSDALQDITVKGEVVDAKTLNTLEATKVTVSIEGKSKDILAGILGEDTLSFDDGVVTMKIPSGAAKELDFTLVIKAAGYVPSSIRLTDIAGEDDYVFVLKLVSLTDPPAGVSLVSQNAGQIDTATGKTQTASTISTTATTEVSETASITVPAGTAMTDSDGNSLSGTLSATVGYYSPIKDSLQSFPGGLNVTLTDEKGEQDETFFVSAGFVSIDITDQNGKVAESFGGGSPSVSLNIPSDLINPLTGAAVQSGESIPVWSYNKETGEWKYESSISRSQSAIVETPDNKLEMSFNIQHLSYYNVDWHGPGSVRVSRPIKIVGKDAGESIRIVLDAEKSGYHREVSVRGDDLNLQNVPSFKLNLTLKKRQYVGGYYRARDIVVGKVEGIVLSGDDDLLVNLFTDATPY